MVSTTHKIWEAVANLDRADTHTAALCHAIINMMIQQGLVTREDAKRQIEESILKVVSVHKQIVNAMQDLNADTPPRSATRTVH